MLVILTEEQVLSPQTVCQSCLLANQKGLPRWRQGKLGCGQALAKGADKQLQVYQCQMGFQLANID
ncbi:MAG: hypothetical protein ACOC0N_07455 [Chroococcales cyanobacterium]